MKISFLFIFIPILTSLSTSTAYNLTVENSRFNDEASKFIGRVIRDWNRRNFVKVSNDITIMNLSNDSSILESVLRRIPKKNPVLLPVYNCQCMERYNETRENDFLVVITGNFSASHISDGIYGCINTRFWSSTSNVIFLPSRNISSIVETRDLRQLIDPCSVAVRTRSVNSVIVYIDDNKVHGVIRCNVFHNREEILDLTHKTNELFNNKFKDMDGYSYSAVLIPDDRHLVHYQATTISPEILIMETIASKQNATLRIIQQPVNLQNISTIYSNLSQGQVDMLLNFGYSNLIEKTNRNFKSVNTYETNGYCALIPIPPKLPFIARTIKILDNPTRFHLIGMILFGAVIWKIFKIRQNFRSESATSFIFKIVCIFFGQLSPFWKNRPVLMIMLQCYVFPLMFLSNMYGSYMFSILVEPEIYIKLINIDEVISGDYKLYSDSFFAALTDESDLKLRLEDTMLPRTSIDINIHKKLMAEGGNNVLIVNCDDSSDLLELQIDSTTKGKDVFYELPEKLFVYYENILLAPKSPFMDALNEDSLRIHESGIKQHWKMLMYGNFQKDEMDDESVFTMTKMLGAIKLYFISISIASTTFVLEIIWSRVMKNYLRIIWRQIIRKIRNCHQRLKKKETRRIHKPKVKFIFVQPKLDDDEIIEIC